MTSRAETNGRLVALVKSIVTDLVQQKYRELERNTGGRRINAIEMQTAVEEYGVVLSMTPDEILASLDVVRVSAPSRPEWSVYCPLWSDKSPTDLTLELTIYEDESGNLRAEIDGIHTL